MFTSCCSYCWCCGDCFDFYQSNTAAVLKARNSPSKFNSSNSIKSVVSGSLQQHQPRSKRISYGTHSIKTLSASIREASIINSSSSSSGTSTPGRRVFAAQPSLPPYDHEGDDDDREIIYQSVNVDDLLEMEDRNSRVVLDTKRLSAFSPAAVLYHKWTSGRNNWSLRRQPLFDQLSGNSTRTSTRLISPFSTDSCDSNEHSSVESCDECEDYHHDSHRGVPRSRMDGYYCNDEDCSTRDTLSPRAATVSANELILQCHQLKDEMADVTAEMETLEGGEDGKNNPKSKQMSIGRKKFNMDPKKGIEYLIEHGLLKNTADDIAKFLYNGEGLSKTAIGDYLGERHDFNQTVLDSFVTLHDFTDLILVQALRQFLWSFRLPGEAQKIDRMMERFAHHYCELNPSIFQHPDTCFVLSFAIIMLNTSLHNPAVRDRDKQTLEQFINMNRGIDNGNDLPRELLESLYESIKTEPFKIPEDDGNDLMHTFFNPDREGWLWKQGGRYKSWKRRWFILNDNCLYYFEYTTDKEPRGIIPLENIEVREVHDRNKPHCFELYATSTDFIKACKTDSEGKVVEGKHTVYRMSASTHEEKEDWIKCIRQSISHNPFYDLLAKRKKNIQKNSS